MESQSYTVEFVPKVTLRVHILFRDDWSESRAGGVGGRLAADVYALYKHSCNVVM